MIGGEYADHHSTAAPYLCMEVFSRLKGVAYLRVLCMVMSIEDVNGHILKTVLAKFTVQNLVNIISILILDGKDQPTPKWF